MIESPVEIRVLDFSLRFRFSAMASTITVPITQASTSWREGMSSDNIKGLVLALSSSFFIGASFIVKKKD
jgi:cyanate permease